ncbi:MAG TPA: glycosyltransferase family 2 protein [Candidatus Andersenbacteria bacterium]|nr:MAG: hypothetical protein A2854_01785 [Parcubacteria group bacterium RIFCSPHIGHO2_01_FULL_56_18]HLD25689.1 glycosyltransferase family 2 protein [Candidatus Andersenbacteria bacterium]
MKLSIIIVNYNTGPLTAACIRSILAQDVVGGLEIIVVDNASADESVAHLRSDFPEVTVIANGKNVGLAAGVNTGLASTRGKYCLILNPDILVLPGALVSLVTYMDAHPTVGVAGGQLQSPNGEVQESCYRFYSPLTLIYRRTFWGKTARGQREIARFLMKDFDHASIRAVDWLLGACLIVRREAVQEVGGMDERFFLYFEDVDWCRRFLEAGWQVMYVPAARFSHFYQRSSEGGILSVLSHRVGREHLKSAVKYFWKNRGRSLPTAAAPLP